MTEEVPSGYVVDRGAGSSGPPSAAKSYQNLLLRLQEGVPVSEEDSSLVDQALGVWARPGFETLISRPRLRFEPFGYQLQAAERALRYMRGRAILADEVGLGKTIEAALVLSELRLRGLAEKSLILAPTGLLEQWQEELDRKFALPSLLLKGGTWEPEFWSGENPVVVASLAAARRSPLRETLTAGAWDLVIVDEAHHLKNPRSAAATLVRELRTRYLLLLTATPVENRLEDLFQLVSLIRPGHLGSPQEFHKRHRSLHGVEPVSNLMALQARVREVMIRHRRSELAMMLPRRLAESFRVAPGAAEAELYRLTSEQVRAWGRAALPAERLALRGVQRMAGSSPQALATALETVGWKELATKAAAVTMTEKARALGGLLSRHLAAGEKVIVFTAFRQTLDFLSNLAAQQGLPHAVYHGSLSRQQKEAAIRDFEAELPVLFSSDAGGEGRNLQFCHVMVNYDLPWNPMRIEQRLGRIHRIGQEHVVQLYNLVSMGTIEERILHVLEARINLFELVVGELDMILGRIDDEFDFEHSVFMAHIESAHDDEFARRLEVLGDDLARAREGYLESRAQTDALVGEATEAR
ncbi:MAG TPA: SNF2-related protein [Candidatus Micrarchaeaceae archaeon]|nr:SNF2-related protein [Candidatus Micrarchaeaceae archaeon]